MHVLREGAGPVAALRLLRSDEEVWGDQPPTAAYVHGLVVDRAQARAAGRVLLRLDWREDNAALRRYYEDRGFRVVDRRTFGGRRYDVVLLEKDLTEHGPAQT